MSAGESIFAQHAWKFRERNISVIPIAPGTKRPGQWTQAGGWRGMSDWTRFSKRFPTDLEVAHWEAWPGAGVGVVLGALSGLIALDKDYDVPNGGDDALRALIPASPVAKRGEKGWTRFYRFNGEASGSFDVQGIRVLDVLADGRQTVVPPSVHPSGLHYVWLSEETLESITSAADLPQLPKDFCAQVEALLAPFQSDHDRQHQRRTAAPREDASAINTQPSIQAEYFRDLNRAALNRLEEWVPSIIPGAARERDGYRCVATWRQATKPNVGVHPSGIRDWGGGYGMTPVDLVMYANGLTFQRAAEVLRGCLSMVEPEPIVLRAGRGAADPSPAVILLPPTTSVEPAPAIPRFITEPPGVLADIAGWITATAPKAQPELSLAAAIALGAACTQRVYRSNLANFTSLYVVLVAKSTEGKEHPQHCVERCLTEAGLAHLIAGSGYTSAGAVFSALLRQPSHIAIIDEIGKLLKLSRSKGNANSEAAIDKLVEAFGKLGGVMRPPVYSTMSLTKAQANAVGAVQLVHNPAITLLGATTPATFYGALTDDLVQDGFLGRILVVESSQPRQLARFTDQTDPPPRVVGWCKAVSKPAALPDGNLADLPMAEMPAHTAPMQIGNDCRELMRAFEAELNERKDALEPERLDVLLGRTLEKALRLAMIAAQAEAPGAAAVRPEHLDWAITYARHYDLALVRAVRTHRVRSQSDEEIKRAVEFVRGARQLAGDASLAHVAGVLAAGAMPRQLLLRKMRMRARDFDAMIDTAVESGVLTRSPGAHLHYAGDVFYCVDQGGG